MNKDKETNIQFVSAIRNKNIALLDYLLKSNRDELYVGDGIKKALETDSTEVIKCFIDNDCITIKETYFAAILSSSTKIIDYLVGLGLDVNSEDSVGLVTALECKNIELIKCLIKHNINVNTYENYPIKYAIRTNNLELMNLLIENGANTDDKNDSLMRIAATNGDKEIVNKLIELGCEIDISKFLFNNHINLLQDLTINGKCDFDKLLKEATIHKMDDLIQWCNENIKIKETKELKEKLQVELNDRVVTNTIKTKI